jgi:hypothetical protein
MISEKAIQEAVRRINGPHRLGVLFRFEMARDSFIEKAGRRRLRVLMHANDIGSLIGQEQRRQTPDEVVGRINNAQ